ncbi:RING finger protein 212B [Hyperolius riggenbachi]|uniref:RING finger protein 212B n=1 Tax=Hyperolius riggenbachi TaxID=752182 RepID=UPI0035A2C4A1
MEWFHCNICYLQQGDSFLITSCGHILCQACTAQDYCRVCRTACKYLPITENLKPQEKIYFRSPKETTAKYFNNISQVCSFQKQQQEQYLAFCKQCFTKIQNALQEALQKMKIQENELKAARQENAELKSCVSHLRDCLSRSQSNSRYSTPRPIAITPPSQTGTPNSQQSGRVASWQSSVRTHSGGSHPTSGSRTENKTTPVASSQGPSVSGHSRSYSLPTQVISTPNLSYSTERSNMYRNQLPTPPNTVQSSIVLTTAMESSATPRNSMDRLRVLQLQFTPRTPGPQSFRRIDGI